MEPFLIDLPFDPREGHPVVGGHEDQGVVEFADGLEVVDHPPEVRVEPLDLEGVVEHVAADRPVVRVVPGKFNGLRIASFAEPRAILVGAVWLLGAVPEAEGLAGLSGSFEELIEVRRIVDVRHRPVRRSRSMPVVRRPGGVSLKAPGLGVAGSPPFAGVADDVAGLLQQVGIDRPLRREDAIMVAGFFKLPGVPPGQDARPAWGAFRVRGEAIREAHPLAGDPIEGRRADPVAAISARMLGRPVVGDHEEDVGPIGRSGAIRDRANRDGDGDGEWTETGASEHSIPHGILLSKFIREENQGKGGRRQRPDRQVSKGFRGLGSRRSASGCPIGSGPGLRSVLCPLSSVLCPSAFCRFCCAFPGSPLN